MNLWKEEWTPMLLSESEKVYQDKKYLYEIKFDGLRAILFLSANHIIIKNRHGRDITKYFPELQQIKWKTDHKIILDGEIVCFVKNRPNFFKLMERIHKKEDRILLDSQKNPVIYMAFDLLYNNKDITSLPLIERKKQLENLADSEYMMKVKTFENGKELYDQTKKLRLEGIISKEKNSSYEINHRSHNWIKIKHQKEEVFYIGGYQENNSKDVISLLLGEIKKNQLQYVGKVTMSKKNPFFQTLLCQNQIFQNPFPKKLKNSHFIVPKYTCLVKYLERTKSNSLRHPILKKIIEKEKL